MTTIMASLTLGKTAGLFADKNEMAKLEGILLSTHRKYPTTLIPLSGYYPSMSALGKVSAHIRMPNKDA